MRKRLLLVVTLPVVLSAIFLHAPTALGSTSTGTSTDSSTSGSTQLPTNCPWLSSLPCLEVHTVPELEGLRFVLLDPDTGSALDSDTTDRNGVAYLGHWSALATDKLTLETPSVSGDGYVAKFERWADNRRHPSRYITFPNGYSESIQVGFDMYYWMTREFEDQHGIEIPEPDRLTSVEMRRSDSEIVDPFVDTTDCRGEGSSSAIASGPCLLQATTLLNTREGLKPSPMRYQIQSVTYDGQNIVTNGANTFTCEWPCNEDDGLHPNARWTISTLFYNVSVNVRDRLLGSRTGSSVDLVYPNGDADRYPLHHGHAELTDIPRGNYTMIVHGPGLSLKAPMNVSQDTDANLVFLSYVDLLIIFGVMALFVGGLFWMGRRRFAREGGTNRPSYLDDVFDVPDDSEVIRQASVTEIRPRRVPADGEAERQASGSPGDVRTVSPLARASGTAPAAMSQPTPEHSGRPETIEISEAPSQHARPMSPEEQAAFHVPTQAELAETEEARRTSGLPDPVERRIVQLQAVAAAKVAASKKPRFRWGRTSEAETSTWGEPATPEEGATHSDDAADVPARLDVNDGVTPSGEPHDGADDVSKQAVEGLSEDDKHEAPVVEHEAPAVVAANRDTSTKPERSQPARARSKSSAKRARSARQRKVPPAARRRTSSAKRRNAPKRKPRPDTAAANGPPSVDPAPNGEAKEPVIIETDDVVETKNAGGTLNGHPPVRRSRRDAASGGEGSVVAPDLEGGPFVISDASNDAEPEDENAIRPIAGGNGSGRSKPPSRRRPPSHAAAPNVAEPSVAAEE